MSVLTKRGIWRQTIREKKLCEEACTWEEDSHAQAQEKDMKQFLPSRPLKDNPTGI